MRQRQSVVASREQLPEDNICPAKYRRGVSSESAGKPRLLKFSANEPNSPDSVRVCKMQAKEIESEVNPGGWPNLVRPSQIRIGHATFMTLTSARMAVSTINGQECHVRRILFFSLSIFKFLLISTTSRLAAIAVEW